jgi:hypothetical protein
MNERLKQLAMECNAWEQVYDNKRFMVDRNFDVEKFATLIIDEFIAICESGTNTQTTSGGAANIIRQTLLK